mmetsp:Transcript_1306/g.3905  ORF Transcript_1306/g.3905 Transcript_1306/m.3905 type:complete len:356 (+) Transcript_1306:621-1688(+)|eukprot:CAMPEP_0206134958 /NCGR_PEP_ID=MMETSP1473-20131121/344_1 /ASSEMBLY_ACC=CAM_ASM_001109 /TAXON_ID=1461547 /ORGANISM="Stichococcus sp, Strain RCC1054" /LENGTH=355 /DNA_ID=CAMNT_0053526623 /DNA_START=558 /DNA_END=1625 /DNA_ORIENTATION=-
MSAMPHSLALSSRRRIGQQGVAVFLLVVLGAILLAVVEQLVMAPPAHISSRGFHEGLLRSANGQPKLFLFIGVLSARSNTGRREAVREAWVDGSQVEGTSRTRFFVAARGDTDEAGRAELAMARDVVLLKSEQTYRTISAATLAVFQHAVTEYDFAFVLKTDDDSFVNVPALVVALQQTCRHQGCRKEGLYMGYQVEKIVVTHGQPDHPHNSDEFWEHTGLNRYPKYMVGGGYVISEDVARMLIITQQVVGLKSYTVEDAAFGYWLQPWTLRHVNHSRFRTIADECCFYPGDTNLTLREYVATDLCSSQPWLVLHKVVELAQMRYLGQRLRSCMAASAATESVAGAASVSTHLHQ